LRRDFTPCNIPLGVGVVIIILALHIYYQCVPTMIITGGFSNTEFQPPFHNCSLARSRALAFTHTTFVFMAPLFMRVTMSHALCPCQLAQAKKW
jgi:hypothetical protein